MYALNFSIPDKTVMKKGKQEVFVVSKYKEFDTCFKKWVAKQSLPVEAVVVTIITATQGATFSLLFETLSDYFRSTFPFPLPRAISRSVDTFFDYFRSAFLVPRPQVTPLNLSLQKAPVNS